MLRLIYRPIINDLEAGKIIRVRTLVKLLAKHDTVRPGTQKIIDCPLYYAVIHRELPYAASIISHLMPRIRKAEAGRLNMSVGDTFAALGRKDKAAVSYKLAKTQLRGSAASYLGRREKAIKVICRVNNHNEGRNLLSPSDIFSFMGDNFNVPTEISNTSCESSKDYGFISSLLRDFSIAQIKFSDVTSNSSKFEYTLIRKTAALAALLSPSQRTYGANLALIGDASLRAGDYSTAKIAFAGAVKYGADAVWIKNNYRYAHQKSSSSSVISKIPDITETEYLTKKNISDMLR